MEKHIMGKHQVFGVREQVMFELYLKDEKRLTSQRGGGTHGGLQEEGTACAKPPSQRNHGALQE